MDQLADVSLNSKARNVFPQRITLMPLTMVRVLIMKWGTCSNSTCVREILCLKFTQFRPPMYSWNYLPKTQFRPQEEDRATKFWFVALVLFQCKWMLTMNRHIWSSRLLKANQPTFHVVIQPTTNKAEDSDHTAHQGDTLPPRHPPPPQLEPTPPCLGIFVLRKWNITTVRCASVWHGQNSS